MPTPHSTLTTHQYNPSLCGATISPLTSRYSIISSGTSDEDNNRNSIYDSTSSQDSSNPELSPPRGPPPPSNTHQCVIEELQKENKQLKTDLEKKTKELEKCKATVKEQSLWIEDLKAVKEKYKSKMQSLKEALQIEANEHDSLRDELEQQVKLLQLKIQEAMQEKESLKKIMRRSPTCGSGSKSRRAQSLGHRASRSLFNPSTSLTSIHEIKIEELKTEVNKTDEVFHSKLGELAQMCEEPSKLNRRWHSDNRLVQHYHRDNNFSFLHSQT